MNHRKEKLQVVKEDWKADDRNLDALRDGCRAKPGTWVAQSVS